jgi:hypothetical protein
LIRIQKKPRAFGQVLNREESIETEEFRVVCEVNSTYAFICMSFDERQVGWNIGIIEMSPSVLSIVMSGTDAF